MTLLIVWCYTSIRHEATAHDITYYSIQDDIRREAGLN